MCVAGAGYCPSIVLIRPPLRTTLTGTTTIHVCVVLFHLSRVGN